jgi:hypothetical protein
VNFYKKENAMNPNETLATLRDNAIKNQAIFADVLRAIRDKKEFKPTYLPASAQINGHEVRASFAVTGRANCARSLHTAGTVRWYFDGKVIAFAKLLAAIG